MILAKRRFHYLMKKRKNLMLAIIRMKTVFVREFHLKMSANSAIKVLTCINALLTESNCFIKPGKNSHILYNAKDMHN